MKHLTSLMKTLLIFTFSSFAFADPFYGENDSEESKKNETSNTNTAQLQAVKKSEKFTACPLPENHNEINLPVEFEDLKLVGILKRNDKFKALFIDKNNQIFDFQKDDLIKERTIQITEITLKQVKYINWGLTEDCESPYQVTLKM